MLLVARVDKADLPQGHSWALIERDGVTTAYVVDGAAEKVARAVYSNANRSPAAESA